MSREISDRRRATHNPIERGTGCQSGENRSVFRVKNVPEVFPHLLTMNAVFRTERVTIVVAILWGFSDNEEKGDRSHKGLQAVLANENVPNKTTSLPTVLTESLK